MKHIYFLLTMILITFGVAAAPSVRWLETRHDFGAFDEDLGPVSTVFKLVNTGDSPVSILSAHASCGCTSPQYTRDPIAPGDTATITVTYDPAGRPGRFTKYVGVELSDDLPKVKLYVSGTVVGNIRSIEGRFPIEATPQISLARSAVMFGPLKKGTMRTLNLQGYNRSTEPITPSVSNLPSYIKVDVVPATVPAGEQFTLIFYFNTSLCPLYGLVEDEADIDGYRLPLTAMVEEDFNKLTPKQLEKAPVATLSETAIDFGTFTRGNTINATFTIRNTGHSALEIRRVYSSDPGVKATAERTTLKPGKETNVNATIDTALIPGDMLNARVAVITNDPANPTQIVRLVGQ